MNIFIRFSFSFCLILIWKKITSPWQLAKIKYISYYFISILKLFEFSFTFYGFINFSVIFNSFIFFLQLTFAFNKLKFYFYSFNIYSSLKNEKSHLVTLNHMNVFLLFTGAEKKNLN